MRFQIKKEDSQKRIVNGLHPNFDGTELEKADIQVVIGNTMTRSEYAKIVADDSMDNSKKMFFLHIISSNIEFVNEQGELLNKDESLNELYENKNTVPQVLFDTIIEEINNYIDSKTAKKKEIVNSSETTPDGEL